MAPKTYAQSETSATGGDGTGTGGSISFTVGLIDFVNDSAAGGRISEGVQQPYLIRNNVITGTFTVCTGSVTSLTDTTSGGTWSSADTTIATVVGGVVTGVRAGVVTISYTVSSPSSVATASVTVSTTPIVGAISGTSTICTGATTTLSDTSTLGSWTSLDSAIATISSAGVVTGVATGYSIIHYTETNACGTTVKTDTVHVSTAPFAGIITGDSVVCVGSGFTLTDTASGGTWSASNTHVTVSSGIVTPVSAGIDTIQYTVSGTCGTGSASKIITINTLPVVAAISGSSFVCTGASTTLADATTGGTWSATNGNATVTAGVVFGISAGTDTIQYGVTNYCGTTTATYAISINTSPVVATLTGTDTVCTGSTVTWSASVAGGSWSASNPDATVTGGSVAAFLSGMDTILYSLTNACGTSTASRAITIITVPTVAGITGDTLICTGGTSTFADATTSGVWSASNTSVTMTGGTATGVSAGVDTIYYSVTASCGTATASVIVTVNTIPAVPGITGIASVCTGSAITLSDAMSGGSWSVANSNATVTAGAVTGISSGLDTVSYSVTNYCGTSAATYLVTVMAAPSVPAIVGTSVMCPGTADTLTDLATGGTWSASNTIISVSGGVLSASVSGVDTISYSLSNICGTSTSAKVVSVTTTVSSGSISGSGFACIGTPDTLSETVTGGTWSMTNVHASISAGVVTAASYGIDTVLYTVTNSCGTATSTTVITVSALPLVTGISGLSNLCTGSVITLADGTSGGTWSATNTNATIAAGVVSGVTAGVDTILYTVTNVCGSSASRRSITINTTPVAGTIGGSGSLCIGFSDTLTETVSGGIWSVSNFSASVSGNIVTGMSVGVDTVFYSVTTACGSATATFPVTINTSSPVGSISGANIVCAGSTILLTDSTSGGMWSASNPAATVTGGVVTAVGYGIDTIYYTVTNFCGTSSAYIVLTVSPTYDAGTITGNSIICTGVTDTFTATDAGGSWSVSNGLGSIDSTGVFTGLASGVDTIYYTVSNPCGSSVTSATVTVYLTPFVAPISGINFICPGTTSTLSDTIPGGIWTSTHPAYASISTSGVVTAYAAGTTLIIYSISNICGSVNDTDTVTVNTLPHVDSIMGSSSMCIGIHITLTDGTSGGTWSASNSRANVSSGGIVSGIFSGIDTIAYTISSTCGSASAKKAIAINPLPNSGIISGHDTICIGSTDTLNDTSAGGSGTWNVTNSTLATVSHGVVTSLATGLDTVIYSVTNGCGTSNNKKRIVIISTGISAISGADSVCTGSSIILTDSSFGGSWSASNTLATVSGGHITGVTSGTDTIYYNIHNACGISSTSVSIVVVPTPAATSITGLDSVCVSASGTFTSPGAVGTETWWVTNANAMVSGNVVTGVAVGTDSLYVTASNSCGSSSVGKLLYILPAFSPGTLTGADSVCPGATIVITASVSGGIWSCQNTDAVVVGGFVTGEASGEDTVIYAVTNSCGTAYAKQNIFVKPLPTPAIVSGNDTICAGSSDSLTADESGVWSVANTKGNLSGHVFNAVTAGIDTVIVRVTNSCGYTNTYKELTIIALPNAGTILGIDTVCLGSVTTFTDSVAGGIWSVSNSNAHDSAGIMTGLSIGLDTLTYTFTNYCGSAHAQAFVHISGAPVASAITAPDSICQGGWVVLSDSVSGGAWSVSNGRGWVSNDTLSGITHGKDTIVYILHDLCGTDTARKNVYIKALPQLSMITGSDTLCIGYPVTFTDSAAGGMWTITNTNASISVDSGIMIGIHAGLDTIVYKKSNSCGTDSVRKKTTIIPAPPIQILSPTDVCIGATITISDSVAGGSWHITNGDLLLSGNVLEGLTAGIDTVSYTANTACGSLTVTKAINVDSMMSTPSILSTSYICIGKTDTLSATPGGGSWAVSDSNAVFIGTGILEGMTHGTDTILYTVTNGCGTTTARVGIRVYTAWECDSVNYTRPQTLTEIDVKVYPNPNTGLFTVELPADIDIQGTQIKVCDLLGQQLIYRKVESNQSRLLDFDLQNVAAGTYFVEIDINNRKFNSKLTVMH